MPAITILFGVLLIPVGVVAFLQTADKGQNYTALIPVALGVLLIVLGALSFKPNLRKHTMHAAALVGLVGLIGGGVRAVPGLIKYLSTGEVQSMPALVGTCLTMFLCLIFLVLCVNSFIQARLRRKAGLG